jgi:hypothetical protein
MAVARPLARLLRMSWSPNDPLYLAPLIAVLIALFISLLIAAVIGGLMPFDYSGRAAVYLGLLLYVIAGAFVIFMLVAKAEGTRSGGAGLHGRRIAMWTASLWVWPLLLLLHKNKNAPGSE